MYCPEGVISIDEGSGKVGIDLEYCKGCGVCAENCPKNCIEMEKE
jgi:pyruvate ferredoxin oxidoreductase delta subunit